LIRLIKMLHFAQVISIIYLVEATETVKNKLTANMNISKRDIVVGNFLGGLAWGIGSVVGAGVIVALIGFALNLLGIFAIIGNFFNSLGVASQQLQNLPQVPNLYR